MFLIIDSFININSMLHLIFFFQYCFSLSLFLTLLITAHHCYTSLLLLKIAAGYILVSRLIRQVKHAKHAIETISHSKHIIETIDAI